jgi:undecaprenyl-diphosphatase
VTAREAFLLGIVQGLTEFFPVSSSGHLAMIQSVLGVSGDGGLVFEIAVHAATLVAIVIFYRRRIVALVTGALRGQAEALVYGAKLAVGTVPAVIVGLTAKDAVEDAFASPALVGLCLLVTGSLLLTTRWTTARAHGQTPSFAMALAIGCAQAFAILPGISRSGTTVAIALALGLAPAAAAEFSFLLGVVAIAGATVLMLPDIASAGPDMVGTIAIGGVAALVSGVAAIWLFVRMLDRQVFHVFAYYAWAVGSLFLFWVWQAR